MAAPPNDSPSGTPEERLAELERGPQLHGRVAAFGRAGADATGELRGRVLVVARPQRRRAPELHVELDAPDRASPRPARPARSGRRAAPSVRRRTAKASSRVASRIRRSAGVETTGSACSTSRSASSGALEASAAAAASIEKRAARSVSPAASACWASIGRPAGAGSPPSRSRSTTAAWTCRRRAADSWPTANRGPARG